MMLKEANETSRALKPFVIIFKTPRMGFFAAASALAQVAVLSKLPSNPLVVFIVLRMTIIYTLWRV